MILLCVCFFVVDDVAAPILSIFYHESTQPTSFFPEWNAIQKHFISSKIYLTRQMRAKSQQMGLRDAVTSLVGSGYVISSKNQKCSRQLYPTTSPVNFDLPSFHNYCLRTVFHPNGKWVTSFQSSSMVFMHVSNNRPVSLAFIFWNPFKCIIYSNVMSFLPFNEYGSPRQHRVRRRFSSDSQQF